jgi:IS5 family transposase
MPIEEFIITVFCWVEKEFAEVTAGVKLRTRGFAPRLSDSEVITMEIVGEFLGQEGDEAIWEYFRRHWAGWFPGLGERSTFVRQAANLWRVKQLLQERLVADLGARTADCHIIDGFPIAVCKLARAPGSKVLKAEADYGYCAAKDEHYYGLKANLLIDLRGVVVGITVTAANVDERDSAYDILQAIEGLLLGDKGYIRPQFKADCEALGIDLQTPLRKNMKEHRPRWWLKLLRRLRKRIETVVSQLEQRFGLAKTRARDAWHLTNQVTRKILAHTLGVWLNIRQGREPLELDSLVTA